MTVTDDFLLGIVDRATQRAIPLGSAPGGGPVNRQADEAAVVKGLVALGQTDHIDQGGTGHAGIQALGEVGQRVVAERARHP
jgi:hypothetical protein